MKTKSIKSFIAVSIIAIAGLTSCQKEKVVPTTKATTHTTDNVALSANTYREVHAIINALVAGSYKKEGFSGLAGCANVTNDTVSIPHVAIIDYGTGCAGGDGRIRSGRIIVQYESAEATLAGNDIYATYESFHFDTLEFLGTVHIAVNGLNGNGNTTVDVTGTGTEIINGAGDTARLDLALNCEWLTGSDTRSIDDDQFDMTGSISGTDFSNRVASEVITTTLRKNFDPRCNFFTQGIAELRVAGEFDKTLDYGNGSCNGLVYVTQNGVTTVENQ
jgi:hypothetical protein